MDRVRMLADDAWAHGEKELADDLHDSARRAERRRDQLTRLIRGKRTDGRDGERSS